ncbi:MAG TPA: discoidin domain-containing protein, partial [Polyangiaceae bacterium]
FFDTPPAGTAQPEYYRVFASHLRFDSLLAGVAMAMLLDGAASKPFMPPRFLKWVVLPASLALVWAIPRALPPNTYFHQGFTAAWFLCAVLVAYASFDRGYVLQAPLLSPVLEYLGARSYALYLLHIPLSRLDGAIGRYAPRYAQFSAANPWTHWALFVLAVVAASEVSWRVLEWPMQKLGRRLTDASLPPWKLGMREVLAMFSAGLLACALPYHHEIGRVFARKNLALGKKVSASSVDPSQPDPQELTNGVLEAERGLHTAKEKEPWALIDLGAPTAIGEIVTYNRADGWQEEGLPFTVEVSEDAQAFTPVGKRTTLFSQWFPWHLHLDGLTARYIRYRAAEGAYVCLAESEVFAP